MKPYLLYGYYPTYFVYGGALRIGVYHLPDDIRIKIYRKLLFCNSPGELVDFPPRDLFELASRCLLARQVAPQHA
jgi:hypothetical protein